MLSIEYRVEDRRWVSKTWNAYGIKWIWNSELRICTMLKTLIQCMAPILSCQKCETKPSVPCSINITYANKVKKKSKFSTSLSHAQYNSICIAMHFIMVATIENQLENILAKGILYKRMSGFWFCCHWYKVSINCDVFIIWVLLGSFMARSKILLFAFFCPIFVSLCGKYQTWHAFWFIKLH